MNINWNSKDYKEGFSFVPKYGEDVLGLITKEKGAKALDLGCGSGFLTIKLKERGYDVAGLDPSKEMLSLARKDYPSITFIESDARTFSLKEKVDLIFSNAVLHWIDDSDQDKALKNIASNLASDGEFVAEMGGVGCAESVHSTLEEIFRERGLSYKRAFYFPSIGEYTPRLERAGFKVNYVILFDRPTPQKGKDGLISWIKMFNKAAFEGLDEKTKEEIYEEARERLQGKLCKDGVWYIDYVRLRFRARKV